MTFGERQFTRNELICTCLARCPLTDDVTDVRRSRLMDRRGEGVPVIFAASRKLAKKEAEYRLINDSELLLTIPSVPTDDSARLLEIASDLSATRVGRQKNRQIAHIEVITKLVLDNPRVTQREMAEACGVSRSAIANMLSRFKNVIRRVGTDRGGYWEIVTAARAKREYAN